MANKFKINDRVKRRQIRSAGALAGEIDGNSSGASANELPLSGALGTVKAVREETSTSSESARERSIMIQVLWDNGTLSYFGPEGLEAI